MHFLDDLEKMRDFKVLSKREFLKSYGYMTEEEYDDTASAYASVFAQASPRVVQPSVESLLDKDPTEIVETAYRTCYQSQNKMTKDSHTLIKKCLYPVSGGTPHTSPLEHIAVELAVHSTSVIGSIEQYMHTKPYCYLSVHSMIHVTGNLRAFWDYWHWAKGEGFIDEAAAVNRAFVAAFPKIFDDEFPDVKDIGLGACTITRLVAPDFRTFKIVTTRDILQEFVRHRTLSFSVESTRYCDYTKRGFVLVSPIPYNWATEPDYRQDFWYDSCRNACIDYSLWLKAGARPEEARMILPGSMKTEFVVSGFAAGWKNFLDLRLDRAAHPQIRLLAEMITKSEE